MPTDRVKVERVTKIPTARADCHEFTVYTVRLDAEGFSLVFRTLNPWKASIAEQARKTKRPLYVTWSTDDGWRDKNIRHVELDQTWRTV